MFKEACNEALCTNGFTNREIVCFFNFLVFSKLSANHLLLDYPLFVLHDASCKERIMRHENVRALRLNVLPRLIVEVYDTNIALNIKTVNFVVMCSSLDYCVGAIKFYYSFCMYQMLPHYFDLLLSI